MPSELRDANPDVPWVQVVGLRNIVAHEYFGLDLEIVWDVVQNEFPILERVAERIRADTAE